MNFLKKKEAFKLMIELFGPWKTWERHHHVAYGLIRQVPYRKMEKYSETKLTPYYVAWCLMLLGAFPDYLDKKWKEVKIWNTPRELSKQVEPLIPWLKGPTKAEKRALREGEKLAS